MGGIVAIAAIFFLPMVGGGGCGSHFVTGTDIIKSNEIGGIVKILLVIALMCAVLAIFLKAAVPTLTSGVVGLAVLIIAYLSVKSVDSVSVELKVGAYFTIFSFIFIVISGFLRLGTNIFGERRH